MDCDSLYNEINKPPIELTPAYNKAISETGTCKGIMQRVYKFSSALMSIGIRFVMWKGRWEN